MYITMILCVLVLEYPPAMIRWMRFLDMTSRCSTHRCLSSSTERVWKHNTDRQSNINNNINNITNCNALLFCFYF